MKKLNFKNSVVISFLGFLILTGCYEFDFVNQPFTADPNSSFEVQISVIKENTADSIVYFGVLLPVGWTIPDSILYTNSTTNESAYVVYSDSLSQQMSIIDPNLNYYWWVGETYAGGNNNDTFYTDLTIVTDNQTGGFFLDYMLGDNYYGLNRVRSNDHSIFVGDLVGCLPEGITFTTQEEIDSFQINYPNCAQIAGNLIISGDGITNLNGLENLTSIGVTLKIINNNNLSSLNGLENIETIGGRLYIENNPLLTGLSGIENVTSIGGQLSVSSNSSLSSLTELVNLASVGGGIIILNNDALAGFSGLDNLTSIWGGLTISNNGAITNLTGLENVTSIGGSLTIHNNDILTNLIGIDNLSSIGGSLLMGYYEAEDDETVVSRKSIFDQHIKSG